MKVFILLRKDQDDYSSLGDVEKVFIFDKILNPSPDYARDVMQRLVLMLQNTTDGDRIIFNGPSWVIAMAGYIWLSDELRSSTGILAYENFQRKYIEVNNAY